MRKANATTLPDMMPAPYPIIPFRAGLAAAFTDLNREWIEQFFAMEESDRQVLGDPEAAIIRRGGQIYFALDGAEAVGTVALIRVSASTYELAKMAVRPSHQSRGLGERLGRAAIEGARRAGARMLFLETNSRLGNAIRLYERLGFVHAKPPIHSPYTRADVYMELALSRRETDAADTTTRVKICCICSREEVDLAVRLGAGALGFVSAMPSGPGVIPESLIAELVAAVPRGIGTFLLTSRTDPAAIIAQQRRTGVNTLQLCDALTPAALAELREALPGIALVPVVHVTGTDARAQARALARSADALLLDSGNPSLQVKELGGTGRTHDWGQSATIVRDAAVPVYLAGGLTAENIAEAIGTVRPFGVDVCSGVRTAGALDERKLRRFMEGVERGTAPGNGGARA